MSRIVTLTCRKLLEAAPEDTAGCKTCHPCNSKQLNKRITFLWGEVSKALLNFTNLSCSTPSDNSSFLSYIRFVCRHDSFKSCWSDFHDRFGQSDNTKVVFLRNSYYRIDFSK